MSDAFPPPPPPQDPNRPGDPQQQPPPTGGYPPPPPPPPPGYAPPGSAQGGYQQYQQHPQHPYGQAGPVDNFGRPLAAWWKRLVASIIDAIVIGIPTSILVFGIAGASLLADTDDGTTDLVAGAGSVLFSLVIGVLSIAYFAILDGSERGQTLGKMALSIQVRDEVGGGPIGYGRGVVRRVLQFVANFLSCFGGVFILLDGLWPLWDPKRQALHDKLAHSVVIDVSR